MRRSHAALLAAGMDAATMPFELFFLRYKVHGATAWMMIVAVLDTLMADGKDDEYIIPLIYTRLQVRGAGCCNHPSLSSALSPT